MYRRIGEIEVILSCQVVCVRDWVNLILKWAGFGICGHFTFSRLQSSQVTGWCCLVFWVWCVVLQNFSVMLYYPHLSLFAHLFAERFHVTVFLPVIIVACYPELCLWDRAGFSFVLVQTQSWLDPTGISGRTFLAFLLSLPCDGQTPSYICDWSWAGISFSSLVVVHFFCY